MIKIDKAREYSRDANNKKEEIALQEKIIDDAILKACDEGYFTCFVETPKVLENVRRKYEKEGYRFIEEYRDLHIGCIHSEFLGYSIFWNGLDDPSPIYIKKL